MNLRGYLLIWILFNGCHTTIPDFYYSDGVRKTWDDAKIDCESRGMEFASLDTAEKHEAAKTYINTHSSTRDVYIGLSLDRSGSYPPYVYIYTNGIVPTYLPWGHPDEPNDQSFHFCIRMHRSYDFGFFTIGCSSTTYDYLCTSPIETQTTTSEPTTVTSQQELITTVPVTTGQIVETTTETDTTITTPLDTTLYTTTILLQHSMSSLSETTQLATTSLSETTQPATTSLLETTQPATTSLLETTQPATTSLLETTQPATTSLSQTTISTENGGETTNNQNTVSIPTDDDDCLCPCSGFTNPWLHLQNSNLTYNELKAIMQYDLDQMKNRLLIDKKETSKYIRSITSAKDNRKSSFSVGIVGITFISIIAAGAIFADCSRLVSSCRYHY